MIPYGRQDVTNSDIDKVIEVLRSDFLTQGPLVPDFEKKLRKKVGAKHAVALNSATSALHACCKALGLGTGDLLWTSPITFVASANCALYCGAEVDFVDIDPDTFNISIDELKLKLGLAEKQGRLPKIIVVVHMAGQSCDMVELAKLGNKYNFKIIEDASHAIGGKYKKKYIGNCEYSEATIFSFHPVKIITTGEGGAVVTNSSELAQSMRLFRSHGITREIDPKTIDREGDWYYEQVDLGFNYRMTDIHAAIGLNQLKRLDQYVHRRNELAENYFNLLSDLPIDLPRVKNDCFSSYHLFIIRLLGSEVASRRRALYDHLKKQGIGVNVHYIPVHIQPFFKSLGFKRGDFPNAEQYYSRALTLPLHVNLSVANQSYIASSLKEKIVEDEFNEQN